MIIVAGTIGCFTQGGYAQCPDTLPPDLVVSELRDWHTQQSPELGLNPPSTGLAFRTETCNIGHVPVDWQKLPDIEHPVIAMNLYRESNVQGATRFEQIGLSWIKHTSGITAGTGCAPHVCCSPDPPPLGLGGGCSDPYSALTNYGQCSLGPRSVLNPFTGVLPSGSALPPSASGGCPIDENYPARDHSGHTHDGLSHRLQVPIATDVAKAVGILLTADDVAGQAYNCYDMYISHQRVATIAKELTGSDSDIAQLGKTPKHKIDTSKLRALGMQFGGDTRLKETVENLLKA